MKNLALIFTLVFATFFDANAMQNSMPSNASNRLNIVRYEVKGNSQFEAIQAPSENKVRVRGILGPGIIIAKNINVNGIKLKYDMIPNDFKLALSRLWRVSANSISYHEETASKDVLSNLFK
jgi:hypothetical protein